MKPWLPPRWLRRGLLDPLWLPVVIALEGLLVATIVVCALVRPLTPRARVLRLAAFGATYLALDAGLLLGSLGLWLRHPTRNRDVEAWTTAHCRLLTRALDRLARTAGATLGYQVEVEAEGVPPTGDRPLIVLARHAGPGDSFTLVQLLLTSLHRRPRVVLKAALQWDPGLDVVLNRLAGCFIASQTGAGDDRTAALEEHARTLKTRDALLLFPEGANWTPRQHRRAVTRLLRAGRRRAAHRAEQQPRVLPPRPAGTTTCLSARPDADVLLVAHTGLDTLTSSRAIWQALPLFDRPMRIRFRWYAAADVPREPEAAQQWLEAQWSAMHAWITAHAPAGGEPPALVPRHRALRVSRRTHPA